MSLNYSRTVSYNNLGSRVAASLRIVRKYVLSYYRSRRERALFKDIRTFCLFIGHPRSGHSIIGALLDAHPQIVLPDEVDVLYFVQAGFNREQIFHILLERSVRQALKGRTKAGSHGTTYSYHVPGQWQGHFNKIHAIGTSKAGRSTHRIAEDPRLLEQLQGMVAGAALKLILTVRNPYDNITTMMLRGNRTFANATERYFANCRTIADLRRTVESTGLLLVKHEELILQPATQLSRLCRFVGVEAPGDYLNACSNILYRAPAKSRYKVEWTTDMIAAVQEQIDQFDFLAGYSYED